MKNTAPPRAHRGQGLTGAAPPMPQTPPTMYYQKISAPPRGGGRARGFSPVENAPTAYRTAALVVTEL